MSLLGVLKGGLGILAGGVGGPAAGIIGSVLGGPKKPSPTPPMFPSSTRPDSTVITGGGISLPTPFGPVGLGGAKSTTYYSGGKKRKKIRRTNPLNPKALRRSIKRVSMFQDFAKSVGFSRAPKLMKGVHAPKRKRTTKCR